MTSPIRFLDNKMFDFYGNIVDMNLRGGKTLVLFYTDTCKDCKNFFPVYEKLAKMNPDVNVCAVSTLKNAKLMARLKKVFPFTVESVPSVVSFDYGSYYSNYDYGMDDDKYYGSLEDLVKYVEGIGKAPVVTKTK